MSLNQRAIPLPPRGGVLVLAAACFAAGLTAGAFLVPAARPSASMTAPAPAPAAPAAAVRPGYPADVMRVLDGDTFEGRVHVWPGIDITTRVRLRGIDAPEMHARCADERSRALTARDALANLLGQGSVAVTHVGQDKYGGRIDADVATGATPDVAAEMLARGLVHRYAGGRRAGWCG